MMVLVLLASVTLAKRMAPAQVEQVVCEGVEYRAPNEKMGVVEAWDKAAGKLLWEKQVYDVKINPNLEKDVQEVFIKKLEIAAGKLVVTNEKNDCYDGSSLEFGHAEPGRQIGCRHPVA